MERPGFNLKKQNGASVKEIEEMKSKWKESKDKSFKISFIYDQFETGDHVNIKVFHFFSILHLNANINKAEEFGKTIIKNYLKTDIIS